MTWALGFLLAGIISAVLAVISTVKVQSDTDPGVSGDIVLVAIFGCAAACLLLLSVGAWIVSVTMAVL